MNVTPVERIFKGFDSKVQEEKEITREEREERHERLRRFSAADSEQQRIKVLQIIFIEEEPQVEKVIFTNEIKEI